MKWRKSVWRKRKPQNNLESYMKNHLFAFWVLMMQPYLLFFNEKKWMRCKTSWFFKNFEMKYNSLEVVSTPKNQAGLSVYSNSYKLTKISCSIAETNDRTKHYKMVISKKKLSNFLEKFLYQNNQSFNMVAGNRYNTYILCLLKTGNYIWCTWSSSDHFKSLLQLENT